MCNMMFWHLSLIYKINITLHFRILHIFVGHPSLICDIYDEERWFKTRPRSSLIKVGMTCKRIKKTFRFTDYRA